MQLKQPKPVKRFFGLNNTSDPIDLGLGWLVTADNINITNTGAMRKRDGYSLAAAGAWTAAYTTEDFQRFYAAVGGNLCAVGAGIALTALQPLASAATMHWAESVGEVFFGNGTDAGIIGADNAVRALKWAPPPEPTLAAVTGSLAPGLYRVCLTTILADGRETGAGEIAEIQIADGQALQISGVPTRSRVYVAPADSTVFQFAGTATMVWNGTPNELGTELETDGLDPLPDGCEATAVWEGRLYAAQYDAGSDTTAIWKSRPYAWHLFNLADEPLAVPGRVHLLAETPKGLVIGTEREIHAYDGENLVTLAPYGVIPGQQAARDGTASDYTRYFWTARGLCRALPFANLTPQVSVAPGIRAAAAVIEAGGQKRFVASLQAGGSPFNAFN